MPHHIARSSAQLMRDFGVAFKESEAGSNSLRAPNKLRPPTSISPPSPPRRPKTKSAAKRQLHDPLLLERGREEGGNWLHVTASLAHRVAGRTKGEGRAAADESSSAAAAAALRVGLRNRQVKPPKLLPLLHRAGGRGRGPNWRRKVSAEC